MSVIKDIIAIYKQNADTKRALRLLNKQEWSIEFLTSLLVKASKAAKQELEMIITDKSGRSVRVATIDKNIVDEYNEDDILKHLDNDVYVNQYIERMRATK